VTTGCHDGGGGPSRPPWTGGRSGQGSSRREREALWELGRLWRGRWEELEGRGVCLGGFCGWCDSFQANRVPFYRRERAGARVSEGGLVGKFLGRGGSGDAVGSRGRVVGDAPPPCACWRRSMTSATVSSRALWLVTGRRKQWLFHRPQPGSGRAPMRDR
jgi:hypothetical protein